MKRFGLPANRLLSLDAFRGLTIAAMILVNNPGSWGHVYAPLRHAAWHGWTPTDMVFPFFLFIMGVAMALTFQRHANSGLGDTTRIKIIFRRGALLFLLGLLLNLWPRFNFADVRILGVLQRIALCYLAISTMLILVRNNIHRHVLIAGLSAVYLALLYLFPVPDFGAADLTTTGNAPAYFDRLILGTVHLWRDGPFDPEGLFSTLPALLSTWLGYGFGMVLTTTDGHSQRLRLWLRYSAILMLVGLLGGLIIPINKQLWTPTYAILMAGWAGLFLALCYWLIEVKDKQNYFRPFIMLGLNPLIIFWMSGFMVRNLIILKINYGGAQISIWSAIYKFAFVSWLPDYPASLLFALLNVVWWIFVAWYLWSKKWYIRL